MKKKILLSLVAAVLLVCFAGCSAQYNYNMDEYVKLGNYKGLAYSDDEAGETVASSIESYLSEKETTNEVTDRAAKLGDSVNIDYTGYIDSVEFDGGSATDTDLTLGEGTFIEDLENGIVGHSVEETFTVDVTFPEDYSVNTDLAGKAAQFSVTINSITETITPELTDELVAADGVFTTVDEYKAYLKSQAIKSQLWEEFYASCEILKYPEKEIGTYYNNMLKNYQSTATSYGYDFDSFVTLYGYEDAEAFCNDLAAYATSQASEELVMWAVVRAENITLSDSEYNEYADFFARQNGSESVEELEESYGKTAIETSAYMQKVLDVMYENATAAVTD